MGWVNTLFNANVLFSRLMSSILTGNTVIVVLCCTWLNRIAMVNKLELGCIAILPSCRHLLLQPHTVLSSWLAWMNKQDNIFFS